MSASALASKNIALLVCSGFEEQPFIKLQQALIATGANVKVISRDNGLTNGWAGATWGLSYPVDLSLSETLAIDYDVMIIPDGVRHSDMLINSPHGERVITAFLREDVPSLIIGSAITSLQSKELLAGRELSEDKIKLDKSLVMASTDVDIAEMIDLLGQSVANAEVEAAA